MSDPTTAEQIAEQLRTATTALRQLEQMSRHIDELGEVLNRRVNASADQLGAFDRSLGELRDVITAFVLLPNGMESLATQTERALEHFVSARADLQSAVDANRNIAVSVTGEIQLSVDAAIAKLSVASAAAEESIENFTTNSEAKISDAARSLAGSAESISESVASKIGHTINGSVELLETSLRNLRESAASALDPTIASVEALLSRVEVNVGHVSTSLNEVNTEGMSELRRSVGEAYGGVQGLLDFAEDRVKGIIDEYQTSVLGVLNQQRQTSDRTTKAVVELADLLDRSTEMQTLSAKLSEDVVLLKRIELAAESVKPSLAKRVELAVTGFALSGSLALWLGNLPVGRALLVALPAPLLTLWLEPLVSPLIREWRNRRS
jgi:hypothetical protein